MHRCPPLHSLILLALLTALSGCGPALDPLDEPIDSSSDRNYHRWLYAVESKLSPDHNERFQRATKQIGLELSVANPSMTTDKRHELFMEYLNGATARQFMAWYEFVLINRLALENRIDQDMLQANFAQLKNVPDGADASIARSIHDQIDAIEKRVKGRLRDIRQIQEGLAELYPTMPANNWEPNISGPRDVPVKAIARRFPLPRDIKAPVVAADSPQP